MTPKHFELRHLVVVGAGPHGLAVLAALAHHGVWPERVSVVDPTDGWCTAWDAKLARLDLDRLRSPQVHHPGVRPMGLRDLVEALPADEQLALRRPEAERVPTPLGMRRYVDELVRELGPIERLRGKATHLEVFKRAARDGSVGGGATAQARVTVRLERAERAERSVPERSDEGVARLDADAVVLAHNPSTPRLPEWAQPLVAAGRARHASAVDVLTDPAAAGEVLIVGGGLTAACLALAVRRRGGRATMFSRRPLRARPYDVDAGWLGPRRLRDYFAATPAERRALIDVARDGGTIPPRTLEELRAAAARGAIGLREGVDVEVEIKDRLASRVGGAAQLWLATGFEQHLARDPLVAPLVAALGVALHDGLPEVTADLTLGDAPVHVIGPYAALAVGPACRNLAGARPAATRIAAALLGP